MLGLFYEWLSLQILVIVRVGLKKDITVIANWNFFNDIYIYIYIYIVLLELYQILYK
jgi:hypothetical protein